MMSSDNRFSKKAFLAKQSFDPLSLRSFRQETLLQYEATNQSEPLRILLYTLATFVFLAAPSFGDLFGNPFDAVGLAGSAVSAAGNRSSIVCGWPSASQHLSGRAGLSAK